jgi:hypothetical protein
VRPTNNFKAAFTITSDSKLLQKVRNAFGMRVSKDYNVSRFTGSDISALAVAEGAFIGRDEFGPRVNTYTGTAEYRDVRYLCAPANSLVSDVQSVDISTDPFYQTPAEVNIDSSRYSCSPKVDIEISMTQGSSQLESALGPCFRREFDRIEFCRNDDTIQQALQNYQSSCPAGGGPGNGGPGGSPPPGGGG